MSLVPRAVVISRPTEYELLLERHGTQDQVSFFLKQRGRNLDSVMAVHDLQQHALQVVASAIPTDWRRVTVDRSDLDRWLFAPEDIVVAVGQDGLVANVAKYLDHQPVLGVNPSGDVNPGVLVPFDPDRAARQLVAMGTDSGLGRMARLSERALVRVVTDSGQQLTALNEIFVGRRTHQSARYTLRLADGRSELQSSSGLLVSTGTGSTGWSRSLWTERRCRWRLPGGESNELAWFVREAWPSRSTGATLVEGTLEPGSELTLDVSSDALVAFGDGIRTGPNRVVVGPVGHDFAGRATATADHPRGRDRW